MNDPTLGEMKPARCLRPNSKQEVAFILRERSSMAGWLDTSLPWLDVRRRSDRTSGVPNRYLDGLCEVTRASFRDSHPIFILRKGRLAMPREAHNIGCNEVVRLRSHPFEEES